MERFLDVGQALTVHMERLHALRERGESPTLADNDKTMTLLVAVNRLAKLDSELN
jgi:hypothetical protein